MTAARTKTKIRWVYLEDDLDCPLPPAKTKTKLRWAYLEDDDYLDCPLPRARTKTMIVSVDFDYDDGPLPPAVAVEPAENSINKAPPPPLPRDIIFEILSRTPRKSVCRLRCVSKEWRAITSDPAFAAAHKLHDEPLVVTRSFNEGHVQLMDMDGGKVLKVINGVGGHGHGALSVADGLLCVINKSFGARVVDLATGEVLATCPELDEVTHKTAAAFAFGRAAPSGAYKVIRLYDRDINGLACGTSEAGAGAPDPRLLRDLPRRIDGVVYFFARRLWYGRNMLLCFDLETEKWSRMVDGPFTLSREAMGRTGTIEIAELNGSVCMVEPEVCVAYDRRTHIWRLVDSDKSFWTKAYTISMDPETFRVMPFRVMPDGGKLLFYCYVDGRLGLVLKAYDPHSDTYTDAMETSGTRQTAR